MASIWTKNPATEPLLMAFMMSLQAILWCSVINPEIKSTICLLTVWTLKDSRLLKVDSMLSIKKRVPVW